MFDFTKLFTWLGPALSVITPISSLRAKIELRDAQLSHAHTKNEALEKENQTLKDENTELRKTVEDHQAYEERRDQAPQQEQKRRETLNYDPFEHINSR